MNTGFALYQKTLRQTIPTSSTEGLIGNSRVVGS